jgi:hypothetical protein
MIRAIRLLAATVVILMTTACAPVADAPVLRVIAIDPGADATLGSQQRFHIKFSLTSRSPLVVTLDPYFEKQPLSANLVTSAPVTLPPSGGSAVAHLSFWGDYATRVDEIRLIAREPKQTAVQTELSLPVKLSWVAREVPVHQPPAWVTEAAPSPDKEPQRELNDRSQWLVFGAVIIAITISGFATRWLRRYMRSRSAKN